MKTLILITLLLAATLAWAQDPQCLPLADSSDQILHCKILLETYPEAVHFYIPKKLDAEKPLQLLAHFHGHNLAGYNHFDPRFGDYGSYLLKAEINAVLVIPESQGNCKTYDVFFANKERTAKFFNQVESVIANLTQMKIEKLALSGHSGAYRVLNVLMGQANAGAEFLSKINGLGLFDATYGATPQIVTWVKAKAALGENFIFFNSYVTGPRATAEEGSLALYKQLKEISTENIFFVPVAGAASESVLDQHFNLLKRGSLNNFWEKLKQN